VRTLTGHSDQVFSVAISPEGKRIVSGSADKLVKIWNAETGAEVSSCVVLHLAKRGGLPESGVRWQVCTLTGHTEEVNEVAFSPDGKRVVSGSDDKLVKIWDVATGAEVSSFGGVCGGW